MPFSMGVVPRVLVAGKMLFVQHGYKNIRMLKITYNLALKMPNEKYREKNRRT